MVLENIMKVCRPNKDKLKAFFQEKRGITNLEVSDDGFGDYAYVRFDRPRALADMYLPYGSIVRSVSVIPGFLFWKGRVDLMFSWAIQYSDNQMVPECYDLIEVDYSGEDKPKERETYYHYGIVRRIVG